MRNFSVRDERAVPPLRIESHRMAGSNTNSVTCIRPNRETRSTSHLSFRIPNIAYFNIAIQYRVVNVAYFISDVFHIVYFISDDSFPSISDITAYNSTDQNYACETMSTAWQPRLRIMSDDRDKNSPGDDKK